jgi:hypothetical protein
VPHFTLSLTLSDSGKIGQDTLDLPAVTATSTFKDKLEKSSSGTEIRFIAKITIPKVSCHEINHIQFNLQRNTDAKVWYKDDDLGNNFLSLNIKAHLLCPPGEARVKIFHLSLLF